MFNTSTTSVKNNQSLSSWWVAPKITTGYSNFRRENNILLIGGRWKRNTEMAFRIVRKEFYHSPTLADNRHGNAHFQRDSLRKCLLHIPKTPWKLLRCPSTNPGLLFLWTGNLHHVRKEAGCFQPEKEMTWLCGVVFGDYLLSSDTKVAVI